MIIVQLFLFALLPISMAPIGDPLFTNCNVSRFEGIAVAHFGRRQVSSAEEGFELPWNMRLALYIADEGGP